MWRENDILLNKRKRSGIDTIPFRFTGLLSGLLTNHQVGITVAITSFRGRRYPSGSVFYQLQQDPAYIGHCCEAVPAGG
jgi:hypothetical protein